MIIIKCFKFHYKLICLLLALILISSFIPIFHSSLAFTFHQEKHDGIKVPIIMYHSILKAKTNKYTVTPTQLENDLKYIQSKGYNTITMTDLINYVYNNTQLPEKPIIITFDDGFYNNLGYAVPLLHKYNMKAVISIVGIYTDTYSKSGETNLNYSYLRWEDIKNLMSDGCIEFQNHTYDMHKSKSSRKGCTKKYGESVETYSTILSNDINKLQNEFNNNTDGYIPNTFTYPLGAISKASLPIIKSLGFKASLSCATGINYITKNPDCLYLLKRNNRSGKISSEQFFKNLLE